MLCPAPKRHTLVAVGGFDSDAVRKRLLDWAQLREAERVWLERYDQRVRETIGLWLNDTGHVNQEGR